MLNRQYLLHHFSHKKNFTTFLSHWEIGKLRGSKEYHVESISPEDKNALLEILQHVSGEERWIPFRYPVDFSEYPEYYAAVPYPIYVELIVKRVKNNYYRQNEVHANSVLSCKFTFLRVFCGILNKFW